MAFKRKPGIPYKPSEDFWSITSSLVRYQKFLEENLIKSVLCVYLGREVKKEDYSKCELVYEEGQIGKYIIAYSNVKLGMVTRTF